ncbi:hypothetical protein HY251_19770, partial [bacterium]|nr:hypothetical protein [bacterium]
MKKKDDSSGPDEASFAQEYDPAAGAVVELHIYCRMCRRMFSVSFAPKPSARLRCPCGYEASLAELDVFKSEARAKDFSTLYEKLYNAAKEALRAANIKLPPSQKLPAIRDGAVVESDIASPQEGNLEDLSDIASAYVGGAKDVRGAGAAAREKKLRDAIGRASGILERHEAFSQLIEHLYCIRHREPGALERFQQACRQDIVIANDVIAEAKRRRAAGRPARVAFTSFKHLAIALEEQGDVAGALEVVLGAIGIGLPGYDERAA